MTTSSTSTPRSIGFWVLLAILAVVDALTIAAAPALVAGEQWGLLVFLMVTTLALNVVYLWPRARASKWILPGFVFMAIFLIWPVIYTAYVSFTNWSDGHLISKEQAIEQLESEPLRGAEEAELLALYVFRNETGELRFWIPDEDVVYFGVPRSRGEEPDPEALQDPQSLGVVDDDGDGVPETVGEFRRLETRDLFGIAGQLQDLVLDLPAGIATVQTIGQVEVVQATSRYVYDEETDTLYDAQFDVTCTVAIGNFVCDGTPVRPGWHVVVGPDNYVAALTRPSLRGPLLSIFSWNMVFAAGSVLLTFAFGLALALAIQPGRLAGKTLYRSLLIIPYAVPAFISAVVWRGLMNTQFGQINRMLDGLGIDPIPWLQDPTWAKVAILLVNLWLGFPYMFLITTGALESVPDELKEVAMVDGAGPVRVFRSVTLPILLISTAPLLIGSFAFNFNNFVLIFILTQGGPPVIGDAVPWGSTDLLITFVFDLAFSAGRGANYALASAYTVLIFVMVAVFSVIGFRLTRNLEKVFAE
ncbi:MAG: ABC transporter permease subunit [Acidimicrobiia bacterium]